MDPQAALERFRSLPPITPQELVGLWKGRGIPTGHPLDGILEELGWFGKRFMPELRADALLFRSGERRLIAINPAWIPIRLALRFHRLGRASVTHRVFSGVQGLLRAKGPVASVKSLPFMGATSAAMLYDDQPITDYFRQIDEGEVMGIMTIEGDHRLYFFELDRVEERSASHP